MKTLKNTRWRSAPSQLLFSSVSVRSSTCRISPSSSSAWMTGTSSIPPKSLRIAYLAPSNARSEARYLNSTHLNQSGGSTEPFRFLARIGVPVSPFPRWMLCPAAPARSTGIWLLRVEKPTPSSSDRARYIHQNCNRCASSRPPSRFNMPAREAISMTFPYHEFVHGSRDCQIDLHLYESGVSGEPSDIYVKCEICAPHAPCPMRLRSSEERRATILPYCRGRRPHLRDFEHGECRV